MGRAEHSRGHPEPSSSGLAAILGGCAGGDRQAAEALRHWDGERVQWMLARALGGPQHTQGTFERLIADLASPAGAFPGGSEAEAQDWLFARMRRAARETGRDDSAAPRLYAVPPRPPAVAPPPVRQSAPPPSPPSGHAGAHTAPAPTNVRLRPAGAPARAGRPTAMPAAARRGKGRAWLRAALLLLGAAFAGLAVAVLALRWVAGEWPTATMAPPEAGIPVLTPPEAAGPTTTAPQAAAPPTLPPQAAAPAIAPPPAPSPPPPAPSLRVQLGPPIAAREPPVEAAPFKPPAPAPQPTSPPVSPVRIVLHHDGSADSSAVADQLAGRLRAAGYGEIEVRAVTFDVATASIRYFYADDRAAAERLVAGIAPFLGWHGRAAPSTPIGFTDFRPLPRRGTLEIWLPRR